MMLLEALSNYEQFFSTGEAYQLLAYQITDVLASYHNGYFDEAVDSLNMLVNEINTYVGYELIVDRVVDFYTCGVVLYDGTEVSLE